MPRHGDNYWLEKIAGYLSGGGGGSSTSYADGAARGTATGVLQMVDDGTNIQSLAGDANGNAKVVGSVASAATDSGNPVKVGAKYNSSTPTFSDGQRADLQVGSRGSLAVTLFAQNSPNGLASSSTNADAQAASGSGDRLEVLSRSSVYNGTTWDRQRGDTTNGAYVGGAVAAAATDSGNPIKVGARYDSTTPTYTNGQRTNLQTDQRGSIRVAITSADGVSGLTVNTSGSDAQSNSISAGNMYAYPSVYNGSTWDRLRGNTVGMSTKATTTRTTISASSAKTTSGNSGAISVGDYRNALITLNCTAASGTTPTLNVKMQASDDGGTTWYDLPSAAFTQLTTTGSQAISLSEVASSFGDTIRAAWTIGGTTPSFTFTVNSVLKT